MTSPLHILVTVRSAELLPAAVLVFKTLRVGFPTAPVYVWGNGLADGVARAIAGHAQFAAAQFHNLQPTCHDAWIEQLVNHQAQPFWICDTDLVFLGPVERWYSPEEDTLFAGRYEPAWRDNWSRSQHVDRLHTCLQYLNPAALRAAMLRWCREEVPAVFHTGQVPFIRQHWIPMRTGKLCYDTTAGLWQAGWGSPFGDWQNAVFEHLHAGTYADEVSKCPDFRDMPRMHKEIYTEPQLARGIQRQQNQFYLRQKL